LKRSLGEIPKKVWERVSGIEPRRLWLQLTNTQNELTNTQNELTNTQNELTNTQNELTNTQNEVHASLSSLNELSREIIQIVGSVENDTIKKSVDVTVIIATRNRFEFLLRALASINRQSQLPLEIVIVNNGEKFLTEEETKIGVACSSISRVQLLDARHLLDVSACRELGLQKVTTKYSTYLDDDNIMWPRWIENAFEFISRRDLPFIYGTQLREDYLDYFCQEFSKVKIREANLIDTNSIMHKSELGRWSPGVSRLSDWSFVLNYLSDHPDSGITQLKSVSTIYKIDAPDRISTPLYSPYRVLIGLLHNLIPDSKQILDKKSRYCVICGTSNSFSAGPNGRANATCMECGSLERHRALFLINEVISAYLINEKIVGKIIEVAPSKVSKAIFLNNGSNYESFDVNPSADCREVDFIADICNIPLPNDSVGEFVALHVLEHVPSDQLAFQEISRVLAPGGVCVLQVPLARYPQVTLEEIIEEDSERIERYGQVDHVRLYGEDILQRMQANGLDGYFFSIEEMIPDFLMQLLGLRDGGRFILARTVGNNLSEESFSKLSLSLRNDFLRLQVFCGLFEKWK
jgi:SAM-dependent methyltransferase